MFCSQHNPIKCLAADHCFPSPTSTKSLECPQSLLESREPISNVSCRPRWILATAWVIFRVTNDSPRRGDSWLYRMPLQANIPNDSRKLTTIQWAKALDTPARIDCTNVRRRRGKVEALQGKLTSIQWAKALDTPAGIDCDNVRRRRGRTDAVLRGKEKWMHYKARKLKLKKSICITRPESI